MILALLIVAFAVTLVLSISFLYATLRVDDFTEFAVGLVLTTIVTSLCIWAFLGLVNHVA